MRHRASSTALAICVSLALVSQFAACAQQVAIPNPPSDAAPVIEGYRFVPVVEQLDHPWAVVWLPDAADSLLITERRGRLWRIDGGARREVHGVPAVYASGQGGLLDITLHPRFAQNRWVYLAFARGTVGANALAVARGRLDGDQLRDVVVIFEATPKKATNQHFGSRFAWLADGTLLVSVGDGGNRPAAIDGELSRLQAQNPKSMLGKVLRMKDDGTPPPPAREGWSPYVYSIGHRNIQGMLRDAATDRVWATEHGSQGGDELNLILPGRNYGWPVVSYSNEYGGGPVAPVGTRADIEAPRTVWTPSIAPSGLALVQGDRYPEWRGNLIAGALRGQQLRRIVLDANGRVLSEERLLTPWRVRDVRLGPDGYLYLLTDESPGALLRVEKKR